MADYPAFDQYIASKPTIADGLAAQRAVSGRLRLQSFYTAPVYDFEVAHRLDDTDLATLLAFYAANRLASFNFVWAADGQTYTCLFTGSPQVTPRAGGMYDVVVKLGQEESL